MTQMILTNNTASDIALEVVGQTLPASSTLTLTEYGINEAAADPTVRAAFACGDIGVAINGRVLTKDMVGSGVLSDIAYGSVTVV